MFPTVRRFPTVVRAFAEALGSERLPCDASWLGERNLDLESYDRELDCDWTSGSFMLCRREALESAGYLDERFFIYSEEPDLCYRLRQAGWRTRHLPLMTIVHHAGKAGVNPKMAAQDAFARRQFARKHFSSPRHAVYIAALGLRYLIRYPLGGERRTAASRALRTLLGLEEPPFGSPPGTAVRIRDREPEADEVSPQLRETAGATDPGLIHAP